MTRGEMPRRHAPIRPKQRPRPVRRILFALLRVLLACALMTGAAVALSFLFPIEQIVVQGASYYTTAQIEQALPIGQGTNLFLWRSKTARESLLRRLPYVRDVSFVRRLPGTVEVTVYEGQAVVAVPTEAGDYMVLSAQGKVLERTDQPRTPARAYGITLPTMQVGQALEADMHEQVNALLCLLEAIDQNDMNESVSFLTLYDLSTLQVGYLDRFVIGVGGDQTEFAYRLRFANTVIAERLSPSDMGRLQWDNKNQLHFIPDTRDSIERIKNGQTNIGNRVVTEDELYQAAHPQPPATQSAEQTEIQSETQENKGEISERSAP